MKEQEEELKKQIEEAREELNRSVVEDGFDKYYQKSLIVDQLLGQLIDLRKSRAAT